MRDGCTRLRGGDVVIRNVRLQGGAKDMHEIQRKHLEDKSKSINGGG